MKYEKADQWFAGDRGAPTADDRPAYAQESNPPNPSLGLDGDGEGVPIPVSSQMSYLWHTPWNMTVATDHTNQFQIFQTDTARCAYTSGSSHTNLNLPEGTVIANVKMVYLGDTPIHGLGLMPFRTGGFNFASPTSLLAIIDSGTSNQSASILAQEVGLAAVVYNQNYVYELNVGFYNPTPLTEVQLCGIRIGYYASILPHVYLPIVGSP